MRRRSGAAAGVNRVGVEGREYPWKAGKGGVDALDWTGEKLNGTGEPRFDTDTEGGSGWGAGEWHRLTVGLCVGVVRVRSGCERATGKWKAGCSCCGESMAEVAIIILWMGGGTLMDLGCCCCCPEGWALAPLGDAEGSRGWSALDLTSCLMSGSSRANIVADAMDTIGGTKDTKLKQVRSIGGGREIVFADGWTGERSCPGLWRAKTRQSSLVTLVAVRVRAGQTLRRTNGDFSA